MHLHCARAGFPQVDAAIVSADAEPEAADLVRTAGGSIAWRFPRSEFIGGVRRRFPGNGRRSISSTPVADTDPHQAWELHELYDPASGRLYELDLVFLSRQGVFLVEIKSHPGALTGDIVDWTFVDGGRRRTIECPYPRANLKAKVLADLLERQLRS